MSIRAAVAVPAMERACSSASVGWQRPTDTISRSRSRSVRRVDAAHAAVVGDARG
eukprot:CAMPEP_0197599708 /NCGR_PEP_ID=MMETSP1326-20131121/31954_1 /TAXON_ID=1155430 /ORGANISM="Genus nov. species nov., Strain RCC2288" /LENGTH=54 /DNA_ID=CAMNT_0043166721 /DNA_START=89 /DNA_END=249 /DNA_ORIENTATION=-